MEKSGQLLLGGKAMTNLDSMLKSRDITLLTKVCIVKAIVVPVVMYSCESWTVKKTECQRIDAFRLWCWKFLKVPWTTNQSILREINISFIILYSLNIHWKDWCWIWSSSILVIWLGLTGVQSLCWEKLRAEGEEGISRWDGWMASLTQWTWTWTNFGRCWGTGDLACCSPWGHRVRHDWATEQQWLWETVWRLLKKPGKKPPHDPTIPLLGTYSEKTTT